MGGDWYRINISSYYTGKVEGFNFVLYPNLGLTDKDILKYNMEYSRAVFKLLFDASAIWGDTENIEESVII